MSTNFYRISLLTGPAIGLLFSYPVYGQNAGHARPKITSISHVGYFVSDLPPGNSVLDDFLGFDEQYTLTKKDSKDIRHCLHQDQRPSTYRAF